VTDISLYSNLSKLLGFSLGSYIYKVNIDEYLIVFIIMFVLFSSFKINNFKNETEKNPERLVFNKLKRKYIIINTALLSGTAVFFIPLFIKQLAARNLIQYSSIIFFIPGLTVVLFLILTKKYDINLNRILMSYIILDILFFILVICEVFLSLQVILLSLIVALGVSISIKLVLCFFTRAKNCALSSKTLSIVHQSSSKRFSMTFAYFFISSKWVLI